MAKKTRKIKYGRILIFILLLIALGVLGFYMYTQLNKNSKQTVKVKSISKIDAYNYVLNDNATEYHKKLFKDLEKTLNEDDVDKDKYATLICQLFVSDFYNLDNKISKNDVGGKQFVYEKYQDDFVSAAMDTMYKTVESNLYGDRKQTLPIVADVKVEKEKNEAFKYGDLTDDNAYIFNFEIEYKEDLGYQKTGTITIIHNGKKLEVAKLTNKESN